MPPRRRPGEPVPKKYKKKKTTRAPEAEARTRPHTRLLAALLAACRLLTVGYAATRYEPVRRAVGMRPLITAAIQPQQGQLPLAKEYVYAGGRLVAAEEPQPAPTPTNAGPPLRRSRPRPPSPTRLTRR